MTINKAIDHFVFKFQNVWKPTPKDIEALETILDWTEKEKETVISNNLLFAKCYVRLLMFENSTYKDIMFSSKQLNKLLIETPIETFYNEFTKRLNDIEFEYFLKHKGLSVDHPALLTEGQKELERKIISEYEEEFKKYTLEGKWTQDQVYESLNNNISELIKFKKKQTIK
ncbi:hypothetical protein [Xanthomarina gelatinilytica]|uniref:hypothetical protein n=1 Tax=Xanthomarina gelatinilytica TaxID=1137281 RepID=UPI003AA7F69F